MNKRTPVSKIMTKDPISVNLTQNLREVDQIFKERNIHHIPVVSGNAVIGLISKNDIERISFVNNIGNEGVETAIFESLTIDQVMTRDVETVDESDYIRDAATILATGKFHALPVLNNQKLSGIVTSTDMINHLLELY